MIRKTSLATGLEQPIVIIGAPRSGTNMLRDVFASLPGVGTWPCDEINYIWRHGNAAHPDDELTPRHATSQVCNYVGSAFRGLARRHGYRRIVEKTCANSLRVAFVDRILPHARYVFLVRNGLDVVASSMRRWTARLDPWYIARKARFVPLSDFPYYALRYTQNRLHRVFSRQRRLLSWGPRFHRMQEYVSHCALHELCAAQWARCVELARRDLEQISEDRVIQVQYEEFVSNPVQQLGRMIDFAGLRVGRTAQLHAVRNVSQPVRKGWRDVLDAGALECMQPLMERQMIALGYRFPLMSAEGTLSPATRKPPGRSDHLMRSGPKDHE